MAKVPFFVAVAMTFAVSTFAAEPRQIRVDEDITYIVPDGSPVGREKILEYGSVEYEGRIMVSGTYEYGYATDDPEDTDNYGEKFLTFILDKPSIAKIPYWSRDGLVANELDINNPDDFIRALISGKQLADLEARRIKSISGTATIWIEKLQTHVECDHQYDTADFSSAVEKNYMVSQSLTDGDGC